MSKAEKGIGVAMKARARVLVTLEVDGAGMWGKDCKVDQVLDQATDEVLGALRNFGAKQWGERNVRFVGKPKVTAVLLTEEGDD